MSLTKEVLLDMYRRMLTIRHFEEGITELSGQGLVPGTGHVSIGEEAVAVGSCWALEEKDYIISTHRAHGHLLAKGADINVILGGAGQGHRLYRRQGGLDAPLRFQPADTGHKWHRGGRYKHRRRCGAGHQKAPDGADMPGLFR